MAPLDRLGKYQLLEQVRYGTLGRLYKAQDPLLKRVVALKVLVEDGLTEDVRGRFFAEARASARLSHPNIITVYDVGEDQGRLFVVMEYVEGEGLDAVIRRRGEVSLEVKISIMLQICRGLGYAHRQGIGHADVKPGNVMLLQDGTVKLLDFGLARIAASANTTATALMSPGALYWPPERGRGRGDRRADIFSAGALFFELTASGRSAVAPAAPSLFAPDPAIPDDLGAVLERAMRREPGQRFEDMAAMEEALIAVDDRLRSEAHELRRRIAASAADLQQLHADLAEGLGSPPAMVSAAPGDATPVAALEARWRDLQGEAARARVQLDRVTAWRPVHEAALAHESAGDFAAAVEAFERVVAAVPEHTGAVQGLERARQRRLEVESARPASGDAPPAAPAVPAPTSAPEPAASMAAVSSSTTESLDATVIAPAPSRIAAPPAASTPSAPPAAFTPPGPAPAPALPPGAPPAGGPPPAPATVGRTLPLLPVAADADAANRPAASGRPRVRWAAVLGRHRFAAAVLVVLALLGIGGAAYWQITARSLARERADLDFARRQLDAARAAATAANAKLLSPDHFADAVALDRVQQDLAEAEQWHHATVSARAAAQAYADAVRQAGSATRMAADDARARMQGDKRRGVREGPEYGRALGQERQGDEHYAAGRFPEAAQAFIAASELFAQSGRAPPEPAPPAAPRVTPSPPAAPAPAPSAPARDAPGATAADPDAEIRDVLRAYARAFETKDLELLQRIRLAMGPDEVARHRSVFDQTRSYRIGLQVQRIVVHGDEAEVRGHRDDTVVTRSGETIRTPGEFRFALRRVGDRWRIDKVR